VLGVGDSESGGGEGFIDAGVEDVDDILLVAWLLDPHTQ
jgi:hypothetical protein